ncbi:N-acetyltransferase [Asticcacaulis sp. EMRT-3]|uniref:N-acetyltransferase n=1 Tax=Asticcacaulis sp. EMRT-3 TaxID=3040349 RepID=UPI0024AF7AA5|nr:N-acetyltransferase [Asticcacaulis sp. EMRT-3]MDI7775698.1 N-acetyltransferase [Asticcacaulis sp. EMRT-3]
MQVREIIHNDHDAVNALWGQVWWPTRSEAGWRWLAANPVLRERPAPQGWVIEDKDGRIAAVLGALAQRYWRGHEVCYGLTGHSLVVSPHLRGASRHLITRIISEPGFTACYTLNANILSHRLYGRFGFRAPPAAVADRKLAWVIDPLVCMTARALRHALDGRPRLARRVGEQLRPKARLWRDPVFKLPHDVTTFQPGAAYAEFWTRLRDEGGWLADRGPHVLEWRLQDPDLTTAPVMLAFQRGGEILGYACAMFAKENPIEPLVLEIIDLQALNTAPLAVARLMDALMAVARQGGAAKLRLGMLSPRLHSQLGPHAVTARSEGGWQHAHVRIAPNAPDLTSWAPTPYDGDLFMSLRPPPRPSFAALKAA